MQQKRYITVDNINKVLWIQVKYSIAGKIQEQEYHDIKNGLWYKYVPAELVDQFRKAVNGGYRVEPVVVSGMMSEEYQVLQIVDLQEVKTNRIIKPVLEV